MDEHTRTRFEAAVERKKDEARDRSHDRDPEHPVSPSVTGDQDSLTGADRKSQDVFSVRDKNSGKGHKTADKWNQ
jgi:hypothetical protein